MQRITTTKDDLEKTLGALTQGLEDPLYRGLGSEAEEEYRNCGTLTPKSGNFSVGTGVFFTNDPHYAKTLTQTTILVTTKKTLDPENKTVDTRVEGYDKPYKQKLDKKVGEGNYDGWTLWEEIQKNDTITYEGGPRTSYVFTKRAQITREKILAEIILQHDN